jgi:hypothetical protein
MTATTTTLPTPTSTQAHRYAGFAIAILLAFSVGMITSVIVFDDDASPAARPAASSPADASAGAAPTMSADATERWALNGTDVYQRKAAVEAAERQAAAQASVDPSRAVDECRAGASAPDAIERCARLGH